MHVTNRLLPIVYLKFSNKTHKPSDLKLHIMNRKIVVHQEKPETSRAHNNFIKKTRKSNLQKKN